MFYIQEYSFIDDVKVIRVSAILDSICLCVMSGELTPILARRSRRQAFLPKWSKMVQLRVQLTTKVSAFCPGRQHLWKLEGNLMIVLASKIQHRYLSCDLPWRPQGWRVSAAITYFRRAPLRLYTDYRFTVFTGFLGQQNKTTLKQYPLSSYPHRSGLCRCGPPGGETPGIESRGNVLKHLHDMSWHSMSLVAFIDVVLKRGIDSKGMSCWRKCPS